MAPYYVEFPADPVVNVRWKKKKDDGPPDPPPDDECFGGTWSYHVEYVLDGPSLLEIHDVLTIPLHGIPGDRSFSSPPAGFLVFRVSGADVEFGPITENPPILHEKNLYGRSLNIGSVLLIEGETVPGSPLGPPGVPPPPFWPGGWIPMFNISGNITPTLSFSKMQTYNVMPPYPDRPFMDRTGSWSYRYSLYGAGLGPYPCFDPDLAPGMGVFYLTSQGSSNISFSSPYQEWWDYYYGGSGGGTPPPWFGDQFYNNLGSTGGSFSLKLTQICGPRPPRLEPSWLI